MVLLKSSPKAVYDPVRKLWVKKTKEEQIRQLWIQRLTEDFGFPLSMLAVEKELSSLVTARKVPQRRIDIVAFAKSSHTLFPLLLIECKADRLSMRFANQVISYNESISAPFIAIANEKQILTGFYNREEKRYLFQEGLSSYHELMACL